MTEEIHSRLLDRANQLRASPSRAIEGLEGLTQEQRDLVHDLDRYPHAFVLGCIMDRQVKAELAWALPALLRERVGSFELEALLDLSADEIREHFNHPRPLHRFPNRAAHSCHLAFIRISERYGGDASRIWSDDIGSAALVRRFLEFHGVGPKIATMAVNILVRDFGIELRDYRWIDISADVHVVRVFQRLGLVRPGASKDEVIYAAREAYPDYPGIFDFVCWEIGRNWCHARNPACAECYMSDLCPTAQGTAKEST